MADDAPQAPSDGTLNRSGGLNMTARTVGEAAERGKLNEQPEKEHELAPPPNATPLEKLLWTPTPGEDATRILFPLSRTPAPRK
jgi:hypothetical protein